MQEFEKLGVFYLGRERDAATNSNTEDLLLYDSRDLTTHGVIVGMTGSGKTGLAISLLEEAAIDNVPAIAIDPKGDLGNILLTFPELRPEDFRPWIDEGEAQRKGLTVDALAAQTAETWRKGLADWGQDPSRIARFRSAVDLAIYTPGSSAGLPLSVLRSLSAPPPALADDQDALRERIQSAVSGLLGLLGIEADPVRSREHILLSRLVDQAWQQGQDLDLAALIRGIQSPPFDRVGVLDLESFFASKDRAELASALNNLLASPGFEAWMEGEPLDIQRLLWTAEGKPRLSIISIAHLSDAERMFFVTLLLNEVVAWMRGQAGTSSLRALLYMDEIFGFFPPVANPPSKLPMLTLYKQARAFGLGVLVATQNPVDLDYKGLSNAGTWFLGRLQTERDKARVLEGLEGASLAAGKAFDQARYDRLLAGLGNRVFLMNNVHDDVPVLFQTRWALSYLRGPLTRTQIQQLMAGRKAAASAAPPSAPNGSAATASAASVSATSTGAAAEQGGRAAASAPSRLSSAEASRPVLPADVPESFLAWRGSARDGEALTYRPALLATARLHFVDAKSDVDQWQTVSLLAPFDADGNVAWDAAETLESDQLELERRPSDQASFASLPSSATRPRSYTGWRDDLGDYLYRSRSISLPSSPDLKLVAAPSESEADFRIRLQQALRERRDEEVEKLRKSFGPKIAALQERIQRAEDRVRREAAQYEQQKMQSVISIGASILGGLLGGGRRGRISVGTLGRATTAVRGLGRAARERGDVGAAEDSVEQIQAQKSELETELQTEIEQLGERYAPDAIQIESVAVRPRKSDVDVEKLTLAWVPWWIGADGGARSAV
jgi:hypothetical protein